MLMLVSFPSCDVPFEVLLAKCESVFFFFFVDLNRVTDGCDHYISFSSLFYYMPVFFTFLFG